MNLNLLHLKLDKEKMSMVLHEFGHALGLEHEHQRSNFWDVLDQKDEKGDDKFIIGKEQMKQGIVCNPATGQIFKTTSDVHNRQTEHSEYDPYSVMHYW